MKSSFRISLCLSLLFIIPLYLLKARLADLSDQYDAGVYLIDWLSNKSAHEWASHNEDVHDKVIVMARLEEEPVLWVEEELSEYALHPPPSMSLYSSNHPQLATSDLYSEPVQSYTRRR
jgi:hypothetical protein